MWISLLLASAIAGVTPQPTSRVASPVVVHGRIVRSGTLDPLANVQVTLEGRPADPDPYTVLTDTEGRFALDAPSWPARVSLRKTGFALGSAAFHDTVERTLTLWPSAVVTGHVVDDRGDPVVAARVVAEDVSAGLERARTVAQADTDDHGEYRLSGLPPDAWLTLYVSTTGTTVATERQGDRILFSPRVRRRYYPEGSSVAVAERIHVVAGDVVQGIDFTVPLIESGSQPLSIYRGLPFGQPPGRRHCSNGPSFTGSLQGHVVTAAGVGLPYAKVLLVHADDAFERRVLETDALGAFAAAQLCPGVYKIVASKPGYSLRDRQGSNVGALLASARTVAATAGTRTTVDDVVLVPWNVVEGTVRDEHGSPVQGARIHVLARRYQRGRYALIDALPHEIRTDDRGRYRAYGMPVGQFAIRVGLDDVRQADWPGYASTYYPGTMVVAEAQPVTLSEATQLADIDITLIRGQTFRVSGTMRDAGGQPTMGGMVRLGSREEAGLQAGIGFDARIGADGRFIFAQVPPGRYVFQTRQMNRGANREGEFAAVPVVVTNHDVTDLDVHATVGGSIEGRVVWDGASPPVGDVASPIRVQALPTEADLAPDGGWAVADVRPGSVFELAGLHGPRRLAVSHVPQGWGLAAIRRNGVDATEQVWAFDDDTRLSDFTIVLADRVGTIAGSVQRGSRQLVSGGHVVIFPESASLRYPGSRYVVAVAVDADGRFEAAGLPAGDYYVRAVDQLPDVVPDAWFDPAWLDTLQPQAKGVNLMAAERVETTVSMR